MLQQAFSLFLVQMLQVSGSERQNHAAYPAVQLRQFDQAGYPQGKKIGANRSKKNFW
jgi:hypothetical protein